MSMYKMESTEDALRKGELAGEYQLKMFNVLRESCLKRARIAMELQQLDKAVRWATKAQFYREAIENR